MGNKKYFGECDEEGQADGVGTLTFEKLNCSWTGKFAKGRYADSEGILTVGRHNGWSIKFNF